MAKTVIEFKNVTKIYKLFKSDRQRFKAVFSKKTKYKKKIAVNDLSFKIEKANLSHFSERTGPENQPF